MLVLPSFVAPVDQRDAAEALQETRGAVAQSHILVGQRRRPHIQRTGIVALEPIATSTTSGGSGRGHAGAGRF